MTQNPMNPPMDWYPDPADPQRERYWDGERWTHNTRPMRPTPMAPPTQNGMHAPFQLSEPTGGQASYGGGQAPYGQAPDGQAPYGQAPYGQGVAPQQYHQGGIMLDARALTADGVPLSGWWRRVFATLLDSLVCGMVSSLVAYPAASAMWRAVQAYMNDVVTRSRAGQPSPAMNPDNVLDMLAPYGFTAHDLLVLTLAGILVGVVYNLALLRWRGATLGQTICGIRVVPTGQGRAPRGLDWSRTLRRVAVWTLLNNGGDIAVIGVVLFLLNVVNVFMPLAHPRRQTLHDLAAGTQVVRTR